MPVFMAGSFERRSKSQDRFSYLSSVPMPSRQVEITCEDFVSHPSRDCRNQAVGEISGLAVTWHPSRELLGSLPVLLTYQSVVNDVKPRQESTVQIQFVGVSRSA
jgi:hypothetical protein